MAFIAYDEISFLEGELRTADKLYEEASGDPIKTKSTWDVYYKKSTVDAGEARSHLLSAGELLLAGFAIALYLTFLRFALPAITASSKNSPG